MKYKTTALLTIISFIMLIGASCSSTGGDGGVFKSTDTGETWEQKVYVGQQKKKTISIAGVNVEKLVFDPTNADVIYLAGKSDGIYKTDNGGEQWHQLNIAPARIRDIAIDIQYPNNVYTVKNNNIIKSTDSGGTWEVVYTDAQSATITGVVVDWYNQQRIYAVTSIGTVLLSEDEGVNWKVIHQVDEPLKSIYMDPNDSRIMYMMELDSNIHKTVDGGATWVELFDLEFMKENKNANRVKQLVMDPNDSNRLYVSSPVGIMRSHDGGTNWEFIDTLIERGAAQNSSIKNIVVMPNEPETILFSVGQQIHKTVDNGVTWKTIENFPSTRTITEMGVHSDREGVIFAGTEFVEQEKKGFIK